MALFQSKWGNGKKAAAVSREARGVVVERFEYEIDEDLAIGDEIEIGRLPAYHFPVDAVLINEALGASVTVDVGIMSGDAGANDAARTVGDELFDGTAVTNAAVTRMSKAAGFQIAATDADRGIGAIIAGAGVTASGQKLTLILTYAQ